MILTQMALAMQQAAAADRYLLKADAIGVGRERAREILREVQGERAGSTPTEKDLNEAECRLGNEWARKR